MATYQELLAAAEDGTLRNKIKVACVIAAEAVRNEAPGTTNHAARLVWARGVFQNPDGYVQQMLWAVLAQNAGATPAQIAGASDSTVQTAVNAAVDVFSV